MNKRYKLIPPKKPIEVNMDKDDTFYYDGAKHEMLRLERLGFKIEEIKPERREFWVNTDHLENFKGAHLAYSSWELTTKFSNIAHVTEIFPGERILSREDVERAWDLAQKTHISAKKNYLKALGFEEMEG